MNTQIAYWVELTALHVLITLTKSVLPASIQWTEEDICMPVKWLQRKRDRFLRILQ